MDYYYKVTSVLESTPNRAARLAVLGAFFPRRSWLSFKKSDTDEVEWALHRLRRKWAERVIDLRNLHWEAVCRNARQEQYIRNCPPFGVMSVDENGHLPCHRVKICPFCYAREYVRDSARLLEKGMCQTSQPRNGKYYAPVVLPDDLWTLLAFKTTTSSAAIESESQAEAYLNLCKNAISVHRRHEVDKFNARYGSVLHTVSYENNKLVFRRRGVLIVPAYQNFTSPNKSVYKLYEINRNNLVDALGWAFRYPTTLLENSPADMTLLILRALSKVRNYSTYGHREFP